MESSVRLYKNTNFDLTNIPDNPNLLNSFDFVDVPFIYVKQNINLSRIKIEKTINELLNIDYCRIADVYYFIKNVNMLNNNVAELMLVEDSITTLGGTNNIKILDGWCTRKHVKTDELFENTIQEDFSPALPFKTDNYKLLTEGYDYDTSVNVILSTVDLGAESLMTAKVFVGDSAESDYSVTVPSLPELAIPTTIGIKLFGGDVIETKYPNVAMFVLSYANIQEAVRTLRSLGLESVIVGSYKIPQIFVDEFITDGVTGRVSKLILKYTEDSFKNVNTNALLNFTYGNYTPANKKVFSNFNNVTVFSPMSGDSFTYEVSSTYHPNQPFVLDFIITPDPSKDGIALCKPKYLNSNLTNKYNWFLETVRGCGWLNTPVTMAEASGNSINAANYAITKAQGSANWERMDFARKIRPYTNLVNNLNALPQSYDKKSEQFVGLGMLNATSTVAAYDPYETLRIMQDSGRDYQTKTLAYEVSQNVVAPDISFPQAVTLQLYYGNIFCATTLRLQDADLERFDKYLTRYGYKVSEILTTDVFTGRKNFNFVEAVGVSITSNSKYASRERRINAAKQLEGGCRIWHVAPTETLIYTNPIV